ncbi:MAG: phosphotransferase [Chitinispirillaceae bacterium]|nr:phosphotransferase [Chitinispirillaceae bacterium]
MDEHLTLTPAQEDFLAQNLSGFHPDAADVSLAGRAGSQRYFIRIIHEGTPYILIVWDSRDEDWERFIAIGNDRVVTGGLLPQLHAADPRHGLILEEDLGAMTLKHHCLDKNSDRTSVEGALRDTLDALHIWQMPQVAAHPVIAARSMDVETFMWETWYFARYCVTDYCGCETLLTGAWERERSRLAEACAALPQTAIHRDFQSENIMLLEGRIRFVDFQGARLGPPQYDVASLLYDPYNPRIDADMCTALCFYYHQHCLVGNGDERTIGLCAAQRLMQALGAYGNLSLHKGKEWYREYIPVALRNLDDVMSGLDGYHEIASVVRACREVVEG